MISREYVGIYDRMANVYSIAKTIPRHPHPYYRIVIYARKGIIYAITHKAKSLLIIGISRV